MRAGKQLRNVSTQPIYWFLNTICPTANVAPKGNGFGKLWPEQTQCRRCIGAKISPSRARLPGVLGGHIFPKRTADSDGNGIVSGWAEITGQCRE